MGKKRPYVKKYRTNRDTISINMEQVANEDPLFPYHSEAPPSDIRRLYKKGHQFCSPSEPKKHRKKALKRHGDNINLDALSLNLKEHSGPFLGKPDEALLPSEIYKLERAYRERPSSLPPEIRRKMDEGRQKNLESLYGTTPEKSRWKPTIYNEKEFDKILYRGKPSKNISLNPEPGEKLEEVFALDGHSLVHVVYDKNDGYVGLSERKRLSKSKLEKYSKGYKGAADFFNYLSLLAEFQAQDRQRIISKLKKMYDK